MDDHKEKTAWMSVPQFGAWDQKCHVDYSMDFSKIRESRKQSKKDFQGPSVGNEEELIIPHEHDRDHDHPDDQQQQQQQQQQEQVPTNSPNRMRKMLRFFICCAKA